MKTSRNTLDLLAEQPFLAGMPGPWLSRLALHGHPAVRPAGNRLFHADGLADRFWLVRSGTVAVDLHVPGRGDVVIEAIGRTGVIGWSWLFPPYRWHFGAVAAELTAVVEFEAAGVRAMMAQEPAFGYDLTSRFLRVVADRLQVARVRLVDLYGY
ncbi:cyclic nucleotide-binding domain-containing protein [Rhizomonospora bruguierae]|uniref:cyclic nucleotide-binding domain-containing protein n=1 Tax=Rhizomonospora bruguierae TaxID=1581705 RepID=UPI001BCEBE5E|nr:cyclic nucleotide-binding domain-containing protein [Micromonospora sp. NBRC 107566]